MKNKDKRKKLTEEFKEFIMRGNVLDMAVGVIIGGAFGKIVTSLVNDILMPFIGVLIGGHSFASFNIKIKDATIMYGSFIQNIVDFLIIAASIFVMIKLISNFTNKISKEKEVEADTDTEVAKAEDIVLLEEIRDLLKKSNKTTNTKKK